MKMLMRAVRGHRGMYLVAAAAYGAAALGAGEALLPWVMVAVYGGMWWMEGGGESG